MLSRKKFFGLFQILSDKRWDVAQKLSTAFSKLKITYPRDYMLSHFLMFDDHFVSFRLLAQIFWTDSWNCLLRSLRIVLTKETFFRTKKCSLLNFGFRAKKFWIFAKKLSRMPNFCSISPEEQFEENNVKKKKDSFVFFQTLRRKTLSCPKNF